MVVDKHDNWNFTYILPPKHPDDEPELIIPDALQVGWSKSLPFFCTAMDTARDLVDKYYLNITNIAPHPRQKNSPKHRLDQHLRQRLWPRQNAPAPIWSIHWQLYNNNTVHQHRQTHTPNTLYPHQNNQHLPPTWTTQLHYRTTNLRKETHQGRRVGNTKRKSWLGIRRASSNHPTTSWKIQCNSQYVLPTTPRKIHPCQQPMETSG